MDNAAVKDILNLNYRRADRLMSCILWGLFLMGLALAGLHDTWGWALAVGLPAAAIPTLLLAMSGGARFARVTVGVACMLFCALHIHQVMGRTEMHFGVFVLLAFLLCYRDWLVLVAAAATVAVHHMSFSALQQLGYPAYCLSQPGIDTVLIHVAYVVAEIAVLCYLARVLKRDAIQAAELRIAVNAMNAEPGVIDLRADALPATSESARALSTVMRRLQHALGSVQHSVRTTAAASGRIAQGNAELAHQAERQGETMRDTARSVAELTVTVQQNAEHARQANALAGGAAEVAARGGVVVGQVVDTMSAIDAASHRIVDITAVIDGIAFQTNILALNAAVEAARAGEQGRGFAVVAGEVRNLAQRAAAAAREIKGLIEDSVGQVEAGSVLVRQAGATMDEVVGSVQRVSGIIAEISRASSAQAEGIGAIGQAIAAMEGLTRDGAAHVGEAAEAAVALKAQAAELAQVVSVFRVEAAPDGLAAPRRAAGRAGRLELAA